MSSENLRSLVRNMYKRLETVTRAPDPWILWLFQEPWGERRACEQRTPQGEVMEQECSLVLPPSSPHPHPQAHLLPPLKPWLRSSLNFFGGIEHFWSLPRECTTKTTVGTSAPLRWCPGKACDGGVNPLPQPCALTAPPDGSLGQDLRQPHTGCHSQWTTTGPQKTLK